MEVELIGDAVDFAGRTTALFDADPISTNVIATVNARNVAAPEPSADTTWVVVTDDDAQVTAAAMANWPWNVFVSAMTVDAARDVADRLAATGRAYPGVNGEATASTAFAERWAARTGCRMVAGVRMHARCLESLRAPVETTGEPHVFVASDVPVIAHWLDAFHSEAMPTDPVEDWKAVATRRIADAEIMGWAVAGTPVAMAAASPPVAGVTRIGPVYTLPEQRGRGYAAAATALVARHALDREVDHVMLYADAANATSNALYERLGFRVHHEAMEYRFTPR